MKKISFSLLLFMAGLSMCIGCGSKNFSLALGVQEARISKTCKKDKRRA